MLARVALEQYDVDGRVDGRREGDVLLLRRPSMEVDVSWLISTWLRVSNLGLEQSLKLMWRRSDHSKWIDVREEGERGR